MKNFVSEAVSVKIMQTYAVGKLFGSTSCQLSTVGFRCYLCGQKWSLE